MSNAYYRSLPGYIVRPRKAIITEGSEIAGPFSDHDVGRGAMVYDLWMKRDISSYQY